MMDDLVVWLLSVLDEVERVARAAADSPIMLVLAKQAGKTVWADFVRDLGPARVLRRVDATRRIIWELDAQASRYRDGDLTAVISPEGRALADQSRRYLRLLALSFVDWPGYREEWRP